MSLDALMAQLQENAARTKSRRIESEQNMMQTMANMNRYAPEAAPRPRGSGGRGVGSSNAKFRGPGANGLIMPVKGARATSNFGPRTHPITGGHSDHTGIDFGVGLGTPIRAVTNGIVREAIRGDSIYGNKIVLGHGRNFQTMYGHMDDYRVKPGQRVKKGQIIGWVGSTGLSTGPHLHFETWRNGSPVNPMKFL